MKAIVYHQYGSPSELHLDEIPQPVPGDGQVLVKVHASSINSWDVDLLRGRPFVNRIGAWSKPRHVTLGCDIAGEVAAVGPNVTTFKPGDAVFGDTSGHGFGGFADFVSVDAGILAPSSRHLSFVEAASLPQAGVLALQGLRSGGELQPGQTLLLNGAGGGVGTIAVQIANARGVISTVVDRGDKLEKLRALGADHVVDYTLADFTKQGEQYHQILDVVGHHSIFAYARALRSKGRCVLVGGTTSVILQAVLLGSWLPPGASKRTALLLHRPSVDDLMELNALVEAGTVAPVIDSVFPLAETAAAFRYFETGNFTGKVAIDVSAK